MLSDPISPSRSSSLTFGFCILAAFFKSSNSTLSLFFLTNELKRLKQFSSFEFEFPSGFVQISSINSSKFTSFKFFFLCFLSNHDKYYYFLNHFSLN